MPNRYVVSDMHLYHDNIRNFTDRPENHNELIIKNWKATIKPDDIVYNLGDVFFGNADFKSIISDLPGRKILIQGNHDRKSLNWYMEHGFDFACQSVVSDGILFSHRPMAIPRGVRWNVHGHFHTAPAIRWERDLMKLLTDKHRIFIIEHPFIGYKPIKLDKFLSQRFNCFDTLRVMKKSFEEFRPAVRECRTCEMFNDSGECSDAECLMHSHWRPFLGF